MRRLPPAFVLAVGLWAALAVPTRIWLYQREVAYERSLAYVVGHDPMLWPTQIWRLVFFVIPLVVMIGFSLRHRSTS